MRHLVYLSHSSTDIHLETIYSIYSYWNANPADVNIILYTDNQRFFEPYLNPLIVSYEVIDEKMLATYKGPQDFIHRVKICILLDALEKYKGSFFFFDSDTYFTRSIESDFAKVEEGVLYMHMYEKNLDRSLVYGPLLNRTVTINGQEKRLDKTVEVWNAGALGLTNSAHSLVQQALRMTDDLLQVYNKHIIEQLAFSYVFQKNSKLNAISDSVFHYWNLKEFRTHLRKIFESPLAKDPQSLLKITSRVTPVTLVSEKAAWKKRGLARLFQRMSGEKFQLQPLPEIEHLLEPLA